MYVLSSLLLPLVLAILFALAFQPLVVFFKKRNYPSWLILPSISVLSLLMLFGLLNIMISTTSDIIAHKEFFFSRLAVRLEEIMNVVSYLTGQKVTYPFVENQISNLYNRGWLSGAIGYVTTSVGSFSGFLVMFSLYYIFLLSGLSDYKRYLRYVTAEGSDSPVMQNIEKIQKSINRYILMKTLINLISATIITVICLLFGIKFAFFWGLLAFILNFIPNFGSIFSIAMPLLMSIIQFDSTRTILILLLVLIAIQFSIGNFIEPRIIGNSLRLNTVTVLFGLAFWGYIWGIAGMMLSIPLMVIIKLTLEHSPSLSAISRIMGYPDNKFK